GEQQGGHRLRVGGDHEKCFGIHGSGLALLADAEAAFEDDLAILVEADRHARNAQCCPSFLDEVLDLRDAFRVEWPGLPAGKRLALETGRLEMIEDRRGLSIALLGNSA